MTLEYLGLCEGDIKVAWLVQVSFFRGQYGNAVVIVRVQTFPQVAVKSVQHDILVYDFIYMSICRPISELITIALVDLIFLKYRSESTAQFLDVLSAYFIVKKRLKQKVSHSEVRTARGSAAAPASSSIAVF